MRVINELDSGNIEVILLEEFRATLEIRKDTNSDFFQWYHFRAEDLIAGKEYEFVIENAGKSSYPDGWKIHNAPYSENGSDWKRLKSNFNEKTGAFSFKISPQGNSAEFAYFEPYSLTRHAQMIDRAKGSSLLFQHSIGKSAQNRDLDLLHFSAGSDRKKLWIIARQHPGESMAEWFMEGALEKILSQDQTIKDLMQSTDLILIPNINPDGSFMGNLRSNAMGANLNREWDKASRDFSPEVFWALEQMDRIGVDALLDIHGDEDIPYVFGSGAEGNPSFTKKLAEIDKSFRSNWEKINPWFQNVHGYDIEETGKADLSLCTNQVSERYNCFALTIEMPFTDNHNERDEEFGWSSEKSKILGKSSLEALKTILDLL